MSNREYTGRTVVPPSAGSYKGCVDSTTFDVAVRQRKIICMVMFFWTKHDMYNPKTCVRLMTNVREFPIGSPWHSIWRPAGLSSNVITTEPCRNPDVDPILTFRKWTWIIYIYDVLSIKTILFDILDFWYQLEKIRFVKTLSKHRMFVSFMKILACWLLHRLIKLNKICWEKRPAKLRPNLRTLFWRRNLKNTQPYLNLIKTLQIGKSARYKLQANSTTT